MGTIMNTTLILQVQMAGSNQTHNLTSSYAAKYSAEVEEAVALMRSKLLPQYVIESMLIAGYDECEQRDSRQYA